LNASHKFYKVNYQIVSQQLRLLDEEGKQIGLVSKIEALQKARELGIFDTFCVKFVKDAVEIIEDIL
jgi:translation initiation factor IF-3